MFFGENNPFCGDTNAKKAQKRRESEKMRVQSTLQGEEKQAALSRAKAHFAKLTRIVFLPRGYRVNFLSAAVSRRIAPRVIYVM